MPSCRNGYRNLKAGKPRPAAAREQAHAARSILKSRSGLINLGARSNLVSLAR